MNFLDNQKLILLAQNEKDKKDNLMMSPLFSLPTSDNILEDQNDIISLPTDIDYSTNNVVVPSLKEKWTNYKQKMAEASTKNPQPPKEDGITAPGKASKDAPSMPVKEAPALGTSAHEKPEEVTEESSLQLPSKNIASLEGFSKILESRDKAQLLNQLARIGAQTTYAMMGKESPFEKSFEAQQEMIEKGPQKYLQQVEFQKQDPNSSISKQYQAVAARMGYTKETAGSSAADIEKMFPQLTNMFTAKEAQIARAQAARTLAQERVRAESEKKETKQEQQKNQFIEYGQKALTKEFAKYQTLENAYNALEQAKKDQVGASDVTILYNFIKSLDPNSVVREGEIALGKRGMSLGGRIYASTLGQFTGEMLNPKFRADVLRIAGRLKDQGYHSYNQTAQVIRDTAQKRYNMSDEELGLIDPLLNRELKQKKAAGKTLVKKGYNAKTNQTQLIYSDGTKEIVDGRQ